MAFIKCTSLALVAFLALGAFAQPLQEEAARGAEVEDDFLDHLQKYVQANDVEVTVPEGMSVLSGTHFTLSPRNIDTDELTLKVKLPSTSADESGKAVGEARKGKLKKILVPILVFVLLKAMTLIPLAIGVLGLKAWNALQLSFFSFVISVALAIFQLCKKIAADASQTQAFHAPYDPHYSAHYARGFANGVAAASEHDAQNLAYSAYKQD